MPTAGPFPSISELASCREFVGQILRRLPDWLLREADRWPDPWQFLLEVPEMPDEFRRFFLAAQSQAKAAYRLAEVIRRAGSFKTSWGREMVIATKARKLDTARHAQDKVFASLWWYDRRRLLTAAKSEAPEIEGEVRRRAEELYKRARRELGAAKADLERRPAVFEPRSLTEKIAWELILGWLRPGYCFCSDEALLKLLSGFLGIRMLEFDPVRKTRQRLGLLKASILVHEARRRPYDGIWEFLNRSGERVF